MTHQLQIPKFRIERIRGPSGPSRLVAYTPDYEPYPILSVWHDDLTTQCTYRTADGYVINASRFFAYLWSQNTPWNAPVERLQTSFLQFLYRHQANAHESNGVWLLNATVKTVGATVGTLKAIHTALRNLYAYAIRVHLYPTANPFGRPLQDEGNAEPFPIPLPLPPPKSGLTASKRDQKTSPKWTRKAPDSFLILVGDAFEVTHLLERLDIDKEILQAGQRLGWGLLATLVTRILFYSGPRISELTGVKFGGWKKHGFGAVASIANKNSRDPYAKIMFLIPDDAALLRRYFLEERQKHDPFAAKFQKWALTQRDQAYTPENYARFLDSEHISADDVPLLLTARKTAYNSHAYRQSVWYPVQRVLQCSLRPHQARHWHVTCTLRTLDALYRREDGGSSENDARYQVRLAQLITNMGWSSEKMLERYAHRHTQEEQYDLTMITSHRLTTELSEAELPVEQPPTKLQLSFDRLSMR